MSPIVLQSRSGPDGKLHLEIPVDRPDTDFEIEVRQKPALTLPPGYFGLLGSVNDDALTVHSQPPLPPSLDVE